MAVFFFPVLGSIMYSFSSSSGPPLEFFSFYCIDSGGMGLVLLSFLARPKSIKYIKWASVVSFPMTTFAGFKSL